MLNIELILLIIPALIIISIVLTKFTDNAGIPTLVLFLSIGMVAGSDGLGQIYFDNAELAQSIGIIALIYILFSGGLDTNWNVVKPAFKNATLLATVGVLITAISIGLFVYFVLGFTLWEGMLIGAIISSTDASAVFSIIRSREVKLKGDLQPILELESGSNDPMAVFLTIAVTGIMAGKGLDPLSLVLLFVMQMGVGALTGLFIGKGTLFLLNKFRLSYEGFYPVLLLCTAAMVYGAADLLGGSGFLAVYVAGVVLGSGEFIYKDSVMRFFDGFAWLGQICMFITLGLFVFPYEIPPIMGIGLAISAFIIFVARPVSVFISLAFSKYNLKEKTFISWVGLKGAVPIILATYPLVENLPDANEIFNIIFFIVVTSVLIQGWSLPAVARMLGLTKEDDAN
ncbi:MAG: potassium/proton antiporter [Ignavibacteriae bacterium]|nr:potassium/proton antiporter [Ignavibacteriota bacterium]MCB9242102.1 potassium/proton antiporter [Ignavibacteriales bacterium]